MPAPLPVITKMSYHASSVRAYEVHVWTLDHGEMDVTLTIPQYHEIHTQLAEHGSATFPTKGSPAA